MINLRNYQKEVVAKTYNLLHQGVKRILVYAPTGAGKTIISSQFVFDIVSKKKRVMFLVHRDILVKQTYQKLQQFNLPCGFIKAGWTEDREALVQIASIQTLESRDWWQDYPVDVFILDEAHLTGFAKVVRRMMSHTHRNSIYLGLSATPYRLSPREQMADVFEAIASAPMAHDLIDQGFLVKPSYYGIDSTDLTDIKVDENGEYNTRALAIATDTPEFVAAVVNEWKQRAWGRRAVAFAVNVKHSLHICEAFTDAGIPAAHVDGSTPIKEREAIYQRLADGQIWVLSNCQALIEGFDVPSVEVLLGCRKTQSEAMHFQMIGRVLRLSPETGKNDALILDFVGNLKQHGFVEDITSVSLVKEVGDGKKRLPSKKLCPPDDGGCGAMLYSFQMQCRCGYHFESRQMTKVLGLKQAIRPQDWERISFYRELLKEAFQSHHAPTWAAVKFKDKYGHFPPFDWAKNAVFGVTGTEKQRQLYLRHLQFVAFRLEKDTGWIERYLQLEFSGNETQKNLS